MELLKNEEIYKIAKPILEYLKAVLTIRKNNIDTTFKYTNSAGYTNEDPTFIYPWGFSQILLNCPEIKFSDLEMFMRTFSQYFDIISAKKTYGHTSVKGNSSTWVAEEKWLSANDGTPFLTVVQRQKIEVPINVTVPKSMAVREALKWFLLLSITEQAKKSALPRIEIESIMHDLSKKNRIPPEFLDLNKIFPDSTLNKKELVTKIQPIEGHRLIIIFGKCSLGSWQPPDFICNEIHSAFIDPDVAPKLMEHINATEEGVESSIASSYLQFIEEDPDNLFIQKRSIESLKAKIMDNEYRSIALDSLEKQAKDYLENDQLITVLPNNRIALAKGVKIIDLDRRLSETENKLRKMPESWWDTLVSETTFIDEETKSGKGSKNHSHEPMTATGLASSMIVETKPEVIPEPILKDYKITYPPFDDQKHIVFGRGFLKGKISWGFEAGKELEEASLITTDLFDINHPHVGSFQQTRTGKSTLAGSVLLQVAFQGIPVIVFDPKPDYVSNIIPVSRTLLHFPDYKDEITKRFLENKQDMRGFDFTQEIPFCYEGRDMKLRFNVYTFDSGYQGLSNVKKLKLPLIVLPDSNEIDFVDQCNSIATSLASDLPGSKGKKYNVFISKIMQSYKKENPTAEFILGQELMEKLEQYECEDKNEQKTVKVLKDKIEDFCTANSYLYATQRSELISIDELIQNPDFYDGDGQTVSISIIDVSSLFQEKKNPVVINYVSRVCGQLLNLTRRKKSKRSVQFFVIFDEAQNYLPNPSDKYNYVRILISRGASLGIKAWIVAQSPQAIEKEARKQLYTLVLSQINPSSVYDELVKFVPPEKMASSRSKLAKTGLGASLVVNRDTGKEGGKICVTFTSPQTVDLLSPKQVVELSELKEARI